MKQLSNLQLLKDGWRLPEKWEQTGKADLILMSVFLEIIDEYLTFFTVEKNLLLPFSLLSAVAI